MRKYSLLSLLLVAIAFIAIDCTREGPEGPVGAQGPQGPAGTSGAPGTPGTPGAPGTANVIYSAWFTPDQNGGWVDTTINGTAAQKKFNKLAPGVNLAMLNNGTILTYTKLFPDGAGGTTTSIRPLPYTNIGATPTQYFPLPYVGSITFAHVSIASPAVAVAAASGTIEFRYVLIPGGVAGGRSMSPAALQALSYEEVCSMFNIPADGTNQ